jgi:hypothetical protein
MADLSSIPRDSFETSEHVSGESVVDEASRSSTNARTFSKGTLYTAALAFACLSLVLVASKHQLQDGLEYHHVAAATMDVSGGVVPTASAVTFLHGAVSWINTQRARDCGVADKSSTHSTDGLAPVDVDTLTLLPPPALTAIEVASPAGQDGLVAAPEVVALVVSIGGGTVMYLLQQDANGSFKARLPAVWLALTGAQLILPACGFAGL